jgi:hypothetical protein
MAAALGLASAPADVMAQTALGAASQGEGARKISLAGRQRMLSQRIVMNACLAQSGVEVSHRIDQVRRSRDAFGAALRSLRHGSDEIRTPAETDPAVLEALATLDQQWPALDAAISALVASPSAAGDPIRFTELLEGSASLLLDSELVVDHLEAKYADDKLLGADLAQAINVAARQHMLSQKMTKELCAVTLGYDADLNRQQLKGTISLFESSRDRLVRRLPGLNLAPPVLDAVTQEQTAADAYWAQLRPAFVAVADGGATDYVGLMAVAKAIDPWLDQLDLVVRQFDASGLK